jgi:serine/threonine-protein kinase
VSSLVFDMVDGRWLAVTAVPGVNCHNGQDERWVIFSLQAKPDGSLTGEWREAFPVGACSTMRTVTFSRTGGVKGSVIDPGDQPPRVQSPAEALHGAYRYTEIFADHTHHHDYSGETYCLRDGRNCLSYLHNPEEGYPLTFAEAKWTALVSGDGPCAGGTEQIQTTSVYPLPQPPQNPITAVSGKGHRTTTGSCTATFDFDVKLERIGD